MEAGGEALHGPRVGIRDSKDKQGPVLAIPTSAWHAFLAFAADPATT